KRSEKPTSPSRRVPDVPCAMTMIGLGAGSLVAGYNHAAQVSPSEEKLTSSRIITIRTLLRTQKQVVSLLRLQVVDVLLERGIDCSKRHSVSCSGIRNVDEIDAHPQALDR